MRREFTLGIKEYLLWVAVLTLALTPAASGLAAYPQEDRFYAGYMYYGYPEGGSGRWGVSAYIYTINPYVPVEHFFSNWDMVVVSYTLFYFIQVGYTKWPKQEQNGQLHFFVEKVDFNGHYFSYVDDTPQDGHTYNYEIMGYGPDQPNYYRIIIRKGTDTKYVRKFWLDPGIPKDLQVFAETTTTAICIDGSHFTYLSYYCGSIWPYWYYWDRHKKGETGGYRVVERGHYEFYAYGGG